MVQHMKNWSSNKGRSQSEVQRRYESKNVGSQLEKVNYQRDLSREALEVLNDDSFLRRMKEIYG